MSASAWIVMCRVSGGVTGTREAPLKRDGVVREFASREEASSVARDLQLVQNGPYATASFHYWAAREGAAS